MALFTIYSRIPYWINIVFGPIVSYIAIVMNVLIWIALTDKKMRSPATVFMQGLALTDGLTSICTYGLQPLFTAYYTEIGEHWSYLVPRDTRSFQFLKENNEGVTSARELVTLKYPYCIVYFSVSQLENTFHLMSVLLTTSLGLHKSLAVLFPLWCRLKITRKSSLVVCLICVTFALAVEIPKLFVISMDRNTTDNVCTISQPNNKMEKYVISYNPIIYASILFCAAVTMTVTTSVIIVTLCKRKRVKKQKSTSEKRSCVMILCVMIVFLVMEIPRLYLNTVVFSAFYSHLDKTDIAWSKSRILFDGQISACYEREAKKIIEMYFLRKGLNIHQKRGEERRCPFGINYMNLLPNARDIIDDHYLFIKTYLFSSLYKKPYVFLKRGFNIHYRELIDDLIDKLFLVVETVQKSELEKMYEVFDCYNLQSDWYEMIYYGMDIIWLKADHSILSTNATETSIPEVVFTGFFECIDDMQRLFVDKLSFLLLGSTPYSEPMNYLLSIVWGDLNISLKQFKMLTEVLNLSTVLGCMSNFIIYLIMSKKLRVFFVKKLFLRRTAESTTYRISTIRETIN